MNWVKPVGADRAGCGGQATEVELEGIATPNLPPGPQCMHREYAGKLLEDDYVKMVMIIALNETWSRGIALLTCSNWKCYVISISAHLAHIRCPIGQGKAKYCLSHLGFLKGAHLQESYD